MQVKPHTIPGAHTCPGLLCLGQGFSPLFSSVSQQEVKRIKLSGIESHAVRSLAGQYQRGWDAPAVQNMIVQNPSGQALAAVSDASQQERPPAQGLTSGRPRPSTVSISLDILFPVVDLSLYLEEEKVQKKAMALAYGRVLHDPMGHHTYTVKGKELPAGF